MQFLNIQVLIICGVVMLSSAANNKADKNAAVLNDLRTRLARLKNLLNKSTIELKANAHQNRHLDIELISQTAWINFYTDRLAKVNQRTIKPVELHLLQEALLHRENRLEEELEVLQRVQQNFKVKQLSAESLLELAQDRLVKYLEVYKKVPDTYRYTVWGAVDELKHMITEIKGELAVSSSSAEGKKRKRMTSNRIAEYEQMVKRIDETMKGIIRYRIYSVVHDREFYN